LGRTKLCIKSCRAVLRRRRRRKRRRRRRKRRRRRRMRRSRRRLGGLQSWSTISGKK